MATVLTSEYQKVATITSPNVSSCKSYLYLKYSGNTVYYKITFIGR